MNNSITVHEWSINWKWDYSWFFKFRNYSWTYKFMNLRTFKNMLFMNNHTLSWTVCSWRFFSSWICPCMLMNNSWNKKKIMNSSIADHDSFMNCMKNVHEHSMNYSWTFKNWNMFGKYKWAVSIHNGLFTFNIHKLLKQFNSY
jgi:hypothetical protein